MRRPLDVPEEFWTRILPVWRKEPLVERHPFAPPFEEEDVWDGWKRCGAAVLAGARDVPLRFYRGTAQAPDPARYVPRAEDPTFEAWLSRLAAEHGEREWGFNLSNPQAWSGPVFRRLLSFLDRLYRKTGFARGGAVPDLFFMNHARSFFGLHKDAQDVITFVISGTRRYLLWPFDAFAAEAGLAADAGLAPSRLPDVDWTRHRERAVVVEAEAGDVLYWPAEWWHAGESTGAPGLTIAVGIVHFANPLRHVARAAEAIGQLVAKETAPLPAPDGSGFEATVDADLDWTRRLASDDALAEELRRDVRAWVTRAGLPKIPAVRAGLPVPRDGDTVTLTSRSALAFRRENGVIRCWAAGRDLVVPERAGLVAMLERLTSGGVFVVGELVALVPEASRTAARELIGTLESFHAVERPERA